MIGFVCFFFSFLFLLFFTFFLSIWYPIYYGAIICDCDCFMRAHNSFYFVFFFVSIFGCGIRFAFCLRPAHRQFIHLMRFIFSNDSINIKFSRKFYHFHQKPFAVLQFTILSVSNRVKCCTSLREREFRSIISKGERKVKVQFNLDFISIELIFCFLSSWTSCPFLVCLLRWREKKSLCIQKIHFLLAAKRQIAHLNAYVKLKGEKKTSTTNMWVFAFLGNIDLIQTVKRAHERFSLIVWFAASPCWNDFLILFSISIAPQMSD